MYNVATVNLLRPEFMSAFYFSRDAQVELAKQMLANGNYKFQARIEFSNDDATDEDILEEVFDLTNNPCRQSERERLYGNGRSVSVGDIVIVNGEEYVCKSIGWEKIV